MFVSLFRYLNIIILTVFLLLFLVGCGGSSEGIGSTDKATTSDSNFTLSIHKASYTIYSTAVDGKVFYGTRNPGDGKESFKMYSAVKSVSTGSNIIEDESGFTVSGKISIEGGTPKTYGFTGMSSGSYIIKPTPSKTYALQWLKVPSRSDIGIITITKSGMVYMYNPDEDFRDNQRSSDGTIIYNIGAPFAISDKTLNGQDFLATLPSSGGISIQF
jgi:hypothetical protein